MWKKNIGKFTDQHSDMKIPTPLNNTGQILAGNERR